MRAIWSRTDDSLVCEPPTFARVIELVGAAGSRRAPLKGSVPPPPPLDGTAAICCSKSVATVWAAASLATDPSSLRPQQVW